MIRRAVCVGLLIWLAIPVGAQSNSGKNQPVPAPSGAAGKSDPSVPPNPVADGGAPIDPKTYVVGAEDVLTLKIWREPDFTGLYTVRPDGKITLPLVGDLQASGLTPERLAAQIKQALAEYINSPDVTVSLAQVNSKKYYVTGEINRPGQYPLIVATHVFDALNNAGGFRDFANKKDIVIIRGDQRLKFNYNDVVKGKKLEQNILLESGDTILVK